MSSQQSDELQIGTMRIPCMVTNFGSEFDGPKARSTSARIAVPDGKSADALRNIDAQGAARAASEGKTYSSFIVGTARNGETPIVRVKITRDARRYSSAPDCGAPANPGDLSDGCSLLLKVTPFAWSRDDPKYGPKSGVTLYGNTVHCGGRLDDYSLTEGVMESQKAKAVVQWE